ncbi:MAG TPA: hypothetical protein VN969_13295 [Streptosporangiaceae bacterium]|nr:hypothetical protein [Streptosporangiaceae bacterium]
MQLRISPAPEIPAQQIDPSGAASTPYPWPTENVRIGGSRALAGDCGGGWDGVRLAGEGSGEAG